MQGLDATGVPMVPTPVTHATKAQEEHLPSREGKCLCSSVYCTRGWVITASTNIPLIRPAHFINTKELWRNSCKYLLPFQDWSAFAILPGTCFGSSFREEWAFPSEAGLMLWHPPNKASQPTEDLKRKGRQEIPQCWCTRLVCVSSAPAALMVALWMWQAGTIPAIDSCNWACWILAIMPYFNFFLFSKLQYSRGGFIQRWSLNQTWR